MKDEAKNINKIGITMVKELRDGGREGNKLKNQKNKALYYKQNFYQSKQMSL